MDYTPHFLLVATGYKAEQDDGNYVFDKTNGRANDIKSAGGNVRASEGSCKDAAWPKSEARN